MEFTERKLVSAKEMLKEGKILNKPSEVIRSIGCHNHRYNCKSHEEFERRVMLKNACRQKGFADAWHMEQHEPEKFQKLIKRCIHNPKHKNTLPQYIQHTIMVAIDCGVSSVRKLANIAGVGKSTIQRWGNDFKVAGESVQTAIRSGLDANTYADPLAALQQFFAGNLPPSQPAL